MTADDAKRWNSKWEAAPGWHEPGPPAAFAELVDHFPTSGSALELACGTGSSSVWLAQRGLRVVGLDVSPVAIEFARQGADRFGVGVQCRFEVWDLDGGIAPGPQCDVVVCHMFRDRSLDAQLVARLRPGGLLAVAALSEVGSQPGPFRARPGELLDAFSRREPLDGIAGGEGGDGFPRLDVVDHGEAHGRTWLVARR